MPGRQKRSLGSLVVETVVVLDEDYVANIRAAGHDTNQSISDLMRLKFTGVSSASEDETRKVAFFINCFFKYIPTCGKDHL